MRKTMFRKLIMPVLVLAAGFMLAASIASAADPESGPAPGASTAEVAGENKAPDDSPGGKTASGGTEAPENLFEYFLAGGQLMWVILACSIVGVAFIIERAINLRRSKTLDDSTYDRVMELVEEADAQEARAHAEQNPGPMSRVLASVLSCAESPRAEMETILEDAGARELWQLQRNAKPLGVIASVSPLFGLLGTVVGIIRAFRDVATEAGAIGNPKLLANGIYEALITTAGGLTVAIPMLLFYHFFRGKAGDLVHEIEEKSLQLIAQIMHQRGDGAQAPAVGGTDESSE